MRWRGFVKLTWTELKLFARDPFATIFALAIPLLMLVLLAAVFGKTSTTDRTATGELTFRGATGYDYYTASSVALMITALGIMSLPGHLASYREQGVLKRMHASAVPAWALFASQLVVSLVVATLGTAVMLIVAAILYGAHRPAAIGGVLLVFVLTMTAFTAFGFLLTALVRTARAAQGLSLMLFFVFWMLSGTGPPRAALPDAARRVGDVLPLTAALRALQDPWFGFGWNAGALIIVALLALAAIPAILLVRWE